ncbi:SH3 domain-containing protein [Bauldia litoralis]|uniref:SH3 domain-containing protein n=1 Tax=Bauldia litoralis TaxID=665467 RepID=UPI0032637D9C
MIRSSMLAALMIAGLAAPALANNATTDGLFVNIRAGAGVNYEPICLAWPNVPFTVVKCEGNWCKVNYLRSSGWMSRKHIVMQN